MLTEVELAPAVGRPDRVAAARNALVTEHLHLVKRIAQQMPASLPSSVDMDDLIQSGMVGLIEAAERYKDDQGASFATYAFYRIRGAMIDAIRDSLWMSRDTLRRLGQFEKVKRELTRDTAERTYPSAAEIAEAAGVSTDEYFRTLQDLHQSKMLSLEECELSGCGAAWLAPSDSMQSPEAEVERDELPGPLRAAISRLNASDRELLHLYYREEWLLREIGDLRSISESRVCQIQKRIIARLRGLLRANSPPREPRAGLDA
jgi:RNA polymerase sigma factor for flagellar operon FliA